MRHAAKHNSFLIHTTENYNINFLGPMYFDMTPPQTEFTPNFKTVVLFLTTDLNVISAKIEINPTWNLKLLIFYKFVTYEM
jgi:hypothetical protein